MRANGFLHPLLLLLFLLCVGSHASTSLDLDKPSGELVELDGGSYDLEPAQINSNLVVQGNSLVDLSFAGQLKVDGELLRLRAPSYTSYLHYSIIPFLCRK